MSLRAWREFHFEAWLAGAIAFLAGFALLARFGLVGAALGLELIAAAFWWWARRAPDRDEQLPRWAWLRRPAVALWLAAALTFVLPERRHDLAPETSQPSWVVPLAADQRDPLEPLRWLRALAVLWAGLELLAALPLSRPYPDLTGPGASNTSAPLVGPWVTAALPAAGFLVLWRQADVWTGAPVVREAAALLLWFAATIAALRAYTRRSWAASLRWLAVADSAFAAMLIALNAVPLRVALLLWIAAWGGRSLALAAELRGRSSRRGPELARLWRIAGWTAGAALSWPLLVAVGFRGGQLRLLEFVLCAAPVSLCAWLSLRRVVEVPDRRAIRRSDPWMAGSRAVALGILMLGPLALVGAWWTGFEASWPGSVFALLPALLGAWPAPARVPVAGETPRFGTPGSARDFALATFRAVTAFERSLAAAVDALLRAIGMPARDLHTGDAQEYLLFLVGLCVLALVVPLFR